MEKSKRTRSAPLCWLIALVGFWPLAGTAGEAETAEPVRSVETWARPALQVRSPGNAVYLAGARAGARLVVVGERGLVSVSDDAGQHWRQVAAPTSATLTGVQFVDAKSGWAIGHAGVVLGTRDGGNTWLRLLDGRTAANLVLQGTKAASAGQDDEVARRALAEAQRLVDEGADKPLLDLCFADEKSGIVVGAYGLALRTDDGGQTWRSIVDGIDNRGARHLYAISRTEKTYYIAGEQGLLLRSDDDGRQFKRLSVPYVGSLFVVRPRGDNVVVAGLRGHVFTSGDRGSNWQEVKGAPPISFIGSYATGKAASDAENVLINQTGQRFRIEGLHLRALPSAPLPPVTGALPLHENDWLIFTLQGLVRQADANGAPRS